MILKINYKLNDTPKIIKKAMLSMNFDNLLLHEVVLHEIIINEGRQELLPFGGSFFQRNVRMNLREPISLPEIIDRIGISDIEYEIHGKFTGKLNQDKEQS